MKIWICIPQENTARYQRICESTFEYDASSWKAYFPWGLTYLFSYIKLSMDKFVSMLKIKQKASNKFQVSSGGTSVSPPASLGAQIYSLSPTGMFWYAVFRSILFTYTTHIPNFLIESMPFISPLFIQNLKLLKLQLDSSLIFYCSHRIGFQKVIHLKNNKRNTYFLKNIAVKCHSHPITG